MCGGGGGAPSAPKVQPAPVAPPVVAPVSADQSANSAAELERKRRQAASGRSDTILTRGLGDRGGLGSLGPLSLGAKKVLGG